MLRSGSSAVCVALSIRALATAAGARLSSAWCSAVPVQCSDVLSPLVDGYVSIRTQALCRRAVWHRSLHVRTVPACACCALWLHMLNLLSGTCLVHSISTGLLLTIITVGVEQPLLVQPLQSIISERCVQTHFTSCLVHVCRVCISRHLGGWPTCEWMEWMGLECSGCWQSRRGTNGMLCMIRTH